MQEPMTLERLERLKKAEPAIYFHIEEMFREGSYAGREHRALRGLIDLGNMQLEAACVWFEYDLMRAPYEVHYLESVIQRWDQIPPLERPAVSRETVRNRLIDLRKEIREKEADLEGAKRGGYFWSIVPLLEFFDLPEEERVGKSCYPLLPSLMQEAYKRLQTPKQPRRSLMSRWIGSIKRLRLAISGTGGEVEIERHEPDALVRNDKAAR